jgi:hypothetical protein
MAATFVEVSHEDMARFLTRAFRALKPTKGVQYSEIYYDLHLGESVAIRVWTSVKTGSGVGAGVGEDAIRISLISSKNGKPLVAGKAPIVKRTTNWRNSLQDRIEDYVELYDEKEESFESSAAQDRKPEGYDSHPTPKQISFLLSLLKSCGEQTWRASFANQFGIDWLPQEEDLQKMTLKEASKLIDTLVKAGFGNRGYGGGGGNYGGGGGYGYHRYASDDRTETL